MRRFLVFVFIFSFCVPLFSQTDSLEALLKTTKQDTQRLSVLLTLSKAYSADKPDTALLLGFEALELADQVGDEKQKAQAFNNLGSTYYFASNYDSALLYHRQAMEIRERIGDKQGLGGSYNNIGNILEELGDVAQALDHYLKAQQFFEETKYDRGLAIVYNSLGNMYYNHKKDPQKALEYYRRSQEIYLKMGNRHGAILALNNIAVVYDFLKQPEKALANYREVLRIAAELEAADIEATALNNIGEVFITLGRYAEAETYLRRAYALASAELNEVKTIGPLVNIGYVFEKRDQLDSAIFYYEKGLEIASRLEWKQRRKDIFAYLAGAHAQKGNFETAFDLMKQRDALKDSLYTEESEQRVSEMQVRFDTEKFKKESELGREKLRQEKIVRWFTVGILAVVLVFSFIVLRAYRAIRRVNKLLDTQRREVLQKNHELQEKNKLIGLQKKEITDSIGYARNIQQATLPSPHEMRRLLPGSAMLYRPRDVVSGDFYFAARAGEELLFAVADCTGHGVPGAFVSMIGLQQLREAAAHSSDPGEILSALNRSIRRALHQEGDDELRDGVSSVTHVKDGMDIILCSWNPATRTLRCAGANRPLWLLRDGALESIKGTNAAIAGFTPDEQIFETHTLVLQTPARLVLSSDGYADQFGGEKGKKFMVKRLQELLRSTATQTLEQQKRALASAFDDWKGEKEQVDDVCILVVEL